MKNRSAIILAGGDGKRFKETSKSSINKTLIKIGNKTILERIVNIAERVSDEVLIIVKDEDQKLSYKNSLFDGKSRKIKIYKDIDLSCEGPLRGIITGLKIANGEKVIILPCDIPYIKSNIVDSLFESVDDNNVSVPIWSNSCLESLIAVYKRSETLLISKLISNLNKNRAQDLIRASLDVKFISVENGFKDVDPKLKSFVNINRKEDLNKSKKALKGSSQIKDNLKINHNIEFKKLTNLYSLLKFGNNVFDKLLNLSQLFYDNELYFWAGSVYKKLSEFEKATKNQKKELLKKAANSFSKEGKSYRNNGILFLSAHSYLDEKYCWQKRGDKKKFNHARKKAEKDFIQMGWGHSEESNA